jgi:hypothetical protein
MKKSHLTETDKWYAYISLIHIILFYLRSTEAANKILFIHRLLLHFNA